MRLAAAFVALALVASGACKKEAPPAQSGDIGRYSQYLVNYPFGGRRLEWWNTRVQELAPGGKAADPAMYALVVERAKKNGLEVTDEGGVPKVQPSKLTTALLLDRLGVK